MDPECDGRFAALVRVDESERCRGVGELRACASPAVAPTWRDIRPGPSADADADADVRERADPVGLGSASTNGGGGDNGGGIVSAVSAPGPERLRKSVHPSRSGSSRESSSGSGLEPCPLKRAYEMPGPMDAVRREAAAVG